ncbi:hypothetical protein K1T71_011903 [Dendrolimus kikuchii]|uniref:Uncharacterized protein n=1 Tax=Dendrolimus kikuchii TaxID=765133 RepID=A0ACC1CMZ6_9NEOP|nr:hypothetical protein K1T71_011903 [Dendrolimus kikuchii]
MLDGWFKKQDEKFSKLIDEFSDIKTSIKFINEQYEDLRGKNEKIEQRVAVLEEKSTLFQNNSSQISILENKMDVMEQQARQCNVEISNVPEKRGENLLTILQEMSSLMKVSLTKQEIVSIHRVPQLSPGNSNPKNIILKFSTRNVRDNFIAAARLNKGITSEQLKISGPVTKIYINEHLTLKNKNLFRQARNTAREKNFRFVWVKHGTIFVRVSETAPVTAIRSQSDLLKIKSM